MISCICHQMAASVLARLDEGMQYPAEVGVNTYVRVRMSHLGKEVRWKGTNHSSQCEQY